MLIYNIDFLNAVIHGNLEEVYSKEQIQQFLISRGNRIFNLAAINGYLEVLKYIEQKAPDKLQDMISSNRYSAFYEAASKGHLDVLKHLEEKAPDKLLAMISAEKYKAFSEAAENGHLEVMKYIVEKYPAKVLEMISAEDYCSFREAAANGHLEVLRYLEALAPYNLQEMISADDYCAYFKAASFGHLHVIQYLEQKAPGKLLKMICAEDYGAFWGAAGNGYLEVIKYIAEKAPNKLNAMTSAYKYSAFCEAAANGHLEVLLFLESKVPLGKLRAMISAEDHYAFKKAAKHGFIEVLQYLEAKAPDKLQAMIKAGNYYAFRKAAKFGYLEILQYLAEKSPNQLDSMIFEDDCSAFHEAAGQGHLDVIKFLVSKVTPEKLQDMIAQRSYVAFWLAAENGHLDVLRYLEEKAPNKLIEMICADDYLAFRVAGENGHLDVLKYIAEKAPNRLKAMISSEDYSTFFEAADKGFLEILLYIEEKAPTQMIKILSNKNYMSFEAIYDNIPSNDYFYHLLDFHQIFDHAEQRVAKYQVRLQPYISIKIERIQAQNFVILDSERVHYYIVLRNLIRSNDPKLLINIQRLINHPQISPLLSRNNNELFRFAKSINNLEACKELLSNQAVNVLARQNNFYNNHTLIDLVNSRRPSMRSLTSEEANLVKDIREHYSKKFVESGGVDKVLDGLLTDLLKRIDFGNDHETRCKDPLFTAWRYLSKSHQLLDRNAMFTRNDGVNIADDNKELIAIFYLAAIDRDQPPTSGTIENRFELFVQGLADLGRAHNQDEGQDRFTEGNKSSSLSGVRKRVFLLLQNHPMFKMINTEIVIQTLEQFANKHFTAKLDESDYNIVNNLYESYVNKNSNEEINKIKKLFDLDPERVHKVLEEELGSRYKEFTVRIDEVLSKKPHIDSMLGDKTDFFMKLKNKVENIIEIEEDNISYKL